MANPDERRGRRRHLRTALVVVAVVAAAVLWPGGLADHLAIVRWRLGDGDGGWPRPEHLALEVRLDPPGGFRQRCRLVLSGVRGRRVPLLLDRDLEVTAAATAGGRPVEVHHGLPLFQRLKTEGRVVWLELDEVPPSGEVELHLTCEGEAESGREGADWRGILYVGEDHARMCEQTVFFPQVPLAPESTAIAICPTEVTVDVPADWDVFSPGERVAVTAAEDGRRRWTHVSESPSSPSIMAGRWTRHETTARAISIVALTWPEHAHLGPRLAEIAAGAIAFYTERFGPVAPRTLGIVEIRCRSGSSYNWAAQDLMAIDTLALDGEEFPADTVAHEAAHLWFGQAATARGEGERFLTEGLAEYASWRWLEVSEGESALDEAVRWARRALGRLDPEESRALRAVHFGTPHYSRLAYQKGPLVARWIEGTVGRDAFDAAVADYVGRARHGPVSLDDFLDAVGGAAGRPVHVPWIASDGDLVVRLEDVVWSPGGGVGDGDHRSTAAGRLSARIVAEPRGGMTVGGSLRLGLLARDGEHDDVVVDIEGPVTPVALPLDVAPLAVVPDPAQVWPHPVDGDFVLDGARLVASEPRQDADDAIFGSTRITVRFDRPLRPIDRDTWRERAEQQRPEDVWIPAVLDVAWDDDRRGATFTVRPLAPGRAYALPLRWVVEDAEGFPVVPEALRFVTAPSGDEEPPTIVSSDPSNGATGVPCDRPSLRIVFSEPMSTTTGFRGSSVRAWKARGVLYPELDHGRWSPDGREIVFPLEEPLEPGRRYVLPFEGSRFLDLSGNLVDGTDILFTASG